MSFTIMSHNEAQQSVEKTKMLINTEHIVSVKPIKIATENRDVLDGYWLRLSNGKKYKAIEVPKIILDALAQDTIPTSINTDENYGLSYQ